jgi:hypothetical protein
MPAQFISTRATPCAASAFASAALTCSSSVTFGRDFFGVFLALVEHADLGALGSHGARGGGTEAGASAGDDNGNVLQLHDLDSFPWAFPELFI